jgi:four helix bundle protein
LQTQLLIAQMHNYISKEKTIELENKLTELQKMIAGFIAKLN